MAVTVAMGQDGFLRVNLEGDLDRIAADVFMQELTPFMDAATTEHPLHMIVYGEQAQKLSSRIRRYFMDANRDERIGIVAIINPSRRLRVLSQFIIKASNKDNIFYVNSEKEALDTITEQRTIAKVTTSASR